MRKCLLIISCLGMSISSVAQAPAGYYDAAIGKSGNALKISLHNIIKGHTAISYGEIWDAVYSTDRKTSGKLWDIYSDIPGSTPPYEYNMGDRCGSGSPSTENNCYNREHTWPQSKFGSASPMNSDLWIVYPTDALVNSKRSNFPYGKVSAPSWSSRNGSKLGPNTYAGAPSTVAFEPIDSFKGDIARTYFYIATRYYSQDGGWDNWEMANGADLKPWAKEMLLEWHRLDPVSAKEIARNEAVYAIQRNRNPYIDYPELVECVFGTADCDGVLSVNSMKEVKPFAVFPNPVKESIQIRFENPMKDGSLAVLDITGKVMLEKGLNPINTTVSLQSLPVGMYLVKVTTSIGIYFDKIIKN